MLNKEIMAFMMSSMVSMSGVAMASSNPFVDVPSDHWAYDAVSKLVDDGVIEGNGNYSFRGQRDTTRYEMAQMVAKAMTKKTSGPDKILVDKLAAEFADELSNLGVRITNLERNADKVQWTGEARYVYTDTRKENTPSNSISRLEMRLFPSAEINEHWKIKARLTARDDMKKDLSNNVSLTYAYAEGSYDNYTFAAGKLPLYSANDEGLIADDFFSGAQLTFGRKVQGILEAGRWDMSDMPLSLSTDSAVNYQGAQINYNGDKLFTGLGYRHFASEGFAALTPEMGYEADKNKADIWSVGADYHFDNNISLAAACAKNTDADRFGRSGNVSLNYKGTNRKNIGSWSAYAAYRHIGQNASLAPTYNTISFGGVNRKGWEIGVAYVPLKNVTTDISYFRGKQLSNGQDSNTFFVRARIQF